MLSAPARPGVGDGGAATCPGARGCVRYCQLLDWRCRRSMSSVWNPGRVWSYPQPALQLG